MNTATVNSMRYSTYPNNSSEIRRFGASDINPQFLLNALATGETSHIINLGLRESKNIILIEPDPEVIRTVQRIVEGLNKIIVSSPTYRGTQSQFSYHEGWDDISGHGIFIKLTSSSEVDISSLLDFVKSTVQQPKAKSMHHM